MNFTLLQKPTKEIIFETNYLITFIYGEMFAAILWKRGHCVDIDRLVNICPIGDQKQILKPLGYKAALDFI